MHRLNHTATSITVWTTGNLAIWKVHRGNILPSYCGLLWLSLGFVLFAGFFLAHMLLPHPMFRSAPEGGAPSARAKGIGCALCFGWKGGLGLGGAGTSCSCWRKNAYVWNCLELHLGGNNINNVKSVVDRNTTRREIKVQGSQVGRLFGSLRPTIHRMWIHWFLRGDWGLGTAGTTRGEVTYIMLVSVGYTPLGFIFRGGGPLGPGTEGRGYH